MTPNNFTIGLRVRVHGDRTISGIDEWQTVTVGEVSLSARLQPPILTLTATGFESEENAERFLPKLICGLWNIALEHQFAFTPAFDRIDTHRPNDPEQAAKNIFGTGKDVPTRVDGLGQGEGYYLCRAGESIRFITLFAPSITIGHPWNLVKGAFLNGVTKGREAEINNNADLSTALDLYVSSSYESTTQAQFITLVSCLEVLAPARKRHATVAAMFEQFEETLKARLSAATDGAEKEAIKAALADASWKKNESISARIRELIRSVTDAKDPNREAYVEKVSKAYEIRSRLLHEGTVDQTKLHDAAHTVREAVKTILSNRLGLS